MSRKYIFQFLKRYLFYNHIRYKLILLVVANLLLLNLQAVVPIARFDVVPYQRIDAGETLNVGVVAFSKAGIDRVEFTISGQGYTGANPLVVNEISYNPRNMVYEYWVPVKASDFKSDGIIKIEAVVYGKDDGRRDKNWLINDSLGSAYNVNTWYINEGNHYEYYCGITSNGLFTKDMVYSNAIIYEKQEGWWNGLIVNILNVNEDSISFKYAESYGTSPVTPDYMPKNGNGFIVSRGFGLDPLVLLVNPLGTLPQPVAYIDTAGNDNTGVVNNPDNPFSTTGKAMVAIRDWMNANGYGNRLSGGMLKLNPGTHIQSNGGYWGSIKGSDEWFTFTSNPDKGGNKDNTFIINGNLVPTHFVKVDNLSVISDDVTKDAFSASTSYKPVFRLWIENCNLKGATKYNEWASPVSSHFIWYTNAYLTFMGKAVSEAQLARNLIIENIGDDAFVRSPFVVNCKAIDIDPRDGKCEGNNCAHADCWQWWGVPVPHNMIIYGYDCLNCTYQGLFARTYDQTIPEGFQNPPTEGVAIVNLHTKLIDPAAFADNAWNISANHMLLWHNTFNEPFNFWNDKDILNNVIPLNITNFEVRGNCFFNMELNAPVGNNNGGFTHAPGIDTSLWEHNHYQMVAGSEFRVETPGKDVTIGDPLLDDDDRPMEISPLINRLSSSIVLPDINNTLRDNNPDIGAYEYQSVNTIKTEKQPSGYGFLHLSPNPARNRVTVTLHETQFAEYSIQLYNSNGIKIFDQTFNDENKQSINISDYPQGIYFVKVISAGTNMATTKLFIR